MAHSTSTEDSLEMKKTDLETKNITLLYGEKIEEYKKKVAILLEEERRLYSREHEQVRKLIVEKGAEEREQLNMELTAISKSIEDNKETLVKMNTLIEKLSSLKEKAVGTVVFVNSL